MVAELAIPGYSFARIFDEVPSTMDVARQSIGELGDRCGVVCARSQSAGRGRQGRTWSSTNGALMATFIFQSVAPVASFSGYSLVVGLALVEALKEFGADTQLKWPNDLVVVQGGAARKLGGILIEVQDIGDRRILLVGVGINLLHSPHDVSHAITVEALSERQVDLEPALVSVAKHLRDAHELFVVSGGFSSFRQRFEDAACFESGVTEITLDLGSRSVSGTYAGVDEKGALILTVEGVPQVYHSGHLTELHSLRECL